MEKWKLPFREGLKSLIKGGYIYVYRVVSKRDARSLDYGSVGLRSFRRFQLVMLGWRRAEKRDSRDQRRLSAGISSSGFWAWSLGLRVCGV